jgi:O-antigen/teichoic acid export membrane protein
LNFFLSVLITIPLTYWFARRFGTIGAAWGTLVSGIIVTVIGQYQNQRVYPIIWEIKKLLVVFSVLVAVCFLVVLSAYIEMPYLALLTSKVALLVVYFILGLHYHFISLQPLYKRFSP